MIVLHGDAADWHVPAPATAVSIGVYDGIHRGHRAVLAELAHAAGGLPTAVLTFDPHPMAVLAPERAPRLLTTRDQKVDLLSALGVDIVAFLRFDTSLAAMEAEMFVERILVETMRAGVVVVGEDFRFGHHRRGTVDMLRDLGQSFDFSVQGVDLVGAEMPYSSTGIRRLIDVGDVTAAAEALGRRYEIRGTVVPGDGRGRGIGFPTANLAVSGVQAIPHRGVYASTVAIAGEVYHGVVNIGVRPTFGGSEEVVEVHVLGLDRDLYGHEIGLEFVQRIRDERRFDGVDELIAQIERDVHSAGRILGDRTRP